MYASCQEKLLALDGDKHKLNQDDIDCRCRKTYSLGGIIGGQESTINEKTTDIVLSAHFVPNLIRSTRKSLNVHTEAATRFERGVDWSICQKASDRAANLIVKYVVVKLVLSQLIFSSNSEISPMALAH